MCGGAKVGGGIFSRQAGSDHDHDHGSVCVVAARCVARLRTALAHLILPLQLTDSQRAKVCSSILGTMNAGFFGGGAPGAGHVYVWEAWRSVPLQASAGACAKKQAEGASGCEMRVETMRGKVGWLGSGRTG